MITLLASLAGFISSLIPEVLKYFVDKSDKNHEVLLLEYQMRLLKLKSNNRLEEVESSGYAEEAKALYRTYKTGVYWVDALNGTVRPILAYAFFGIYSFIKILQYRLIEHSLNITDIITILWNGDDQAIFAGIISFYFGQRAITKLKVK
ncbi:MAG: hypothetical protein N4A31_02970 [Rickettsiales bacterium]|jgi:hypothetical protein|nr:hypothetical protein [Rickettsiales bacterium]